MGFSILPSNTKWSIPPALFFASASKCTVHLLIVESSVATLIWTTFGPGLTIPVTFLPSQFMITVKSLRFVAVWPNSPYQVPVIGCPSWATADAVNERTIRRLIKHTDFTRIQPPYLRNKQNTAIHGLLTA